MSITKLDRKVPSTDGIHTLAGVVYVPDGEPVGLFHVVHGMTEHIGRYDGFMRRLAEAGYVTFGYDNLGHGYTARDDSELGYIAHEDGWKLLAEDVKAFADDVKREYPSLPYYLLGHSMGSFIVRVSAATVCRPDKLIVMGTGGPNPATGAGLALIKVIKTFRGEKHVSGTIQKMAFGKYNEGFDGDDPRRWLTHDREITEKYAADKFCTFGFTVSAMRDLLLLNKYANGDEWFEKISAEEGGKKLPILLVSGEEDPVGDHSRGVKAVFEGLEKRGADVKMKLYPDGRHEILNDYMKDEVTSDILGFIR
ncbi:MAG: lysophospholipase [Clostridia bacterium]|nr:lysophospholipase [Clostridia bacterium]